jgi:hypothetical protein
MAKQNGGEQSVHLRGQPRRLESLVLVPPEQAQAAPVAAEFRSEKHKAQPLAIAKPLGTAGLRLRLKFPHNTPPGSYEGLVRIGTSEFKMVVEVDAEPHLDLVPSQLRLNGTPDGEATAELTVVNDGNAPFVIRNAYGVGLFALGGVENALGAAYREAKEGGQERLNMLADKLAEQHGGLLRVNVRQGAGELGPDQMRALRLQVKFPGNLRPGNTYTGTFRVHNARCVVRVEVPRKTGEEIR